MKRYNSIMKLNLVLILLLLISCAAGANKNGGIMSKELANMAAEKNSSTEYNSAKMRSEHILAVEVEVTAEGIRPIGSKIIRAPMKKSSALADLHLKAMAEQSVLVEYTFPDPRLVEVDSLEHKTLPRATTFVFLPLTSSLSEVRISPVKGREKMVSGGGVFDPRPMMKKACEGEKMLDECKKILEMK